MNKVKWQEPAAFRKAYIREHSPPRSPWGQLLFALGIGAVGIVPLLQGREPMVANWPTTFGVLLLVGVMIAYGIPWLSSRNSTLVGLGEHGLGWNEMQGAGVRMVRWPWEYIEACSLERQTVGGTEWPVLVIESCEGEAMVFALDPKVAPEAIAEVVQAHGKPVHWGL